MSLKTESGTPKKYINCVDIKRQFLVHKMCLPELSFFVIKISFVFQSNGY